jgi:hypothetical protein
MAHTWSMRSRGTLPINGLYYSSFLGAVTKLTKNATEAIKHSFPSNLYDPTTIFLYHQIEKTCFYDFLLYTGD